MQSFYMLNQGQDSVQTYHKKFNAAIDVTIEMGGNIGESETSTNYSLERNEFIPNAATRAQKNAARITGAEMYKAMAFTMGIDRKRYGKLIKDLSNNYLLRNNNYPCIVNSAYNPLQN